VGSLVLYQAEWCPFSSAVREVLTELGLDFVARQVEPWPEEREHLRAVAHTQHIPVLETEDGRFYRGTREIFGYLRSREAWRFEAAHRRRFGDHRDARETDVPGQLLAFFHGDDDLEAANHPTGEIAIADVPEASRYELRLDGRLVGFAAYRRRNNRIVFTHTEVDPSCAGRGLGSRLAAFALDDTVRQGLEVVPLCPFVAHYIDEHPEYEAQVAEGHRQATRAAP
jgi:predicted GNAT family acetyltransferase/glutaredoxin